MYSSNPQVSKQENQKTPQDLKREAQGSQKAFLEEVVSIPTTAKSNKALFYTLIIGAVVIVEIIVAGLVILNKKSQLGTKEKIIADAKQELGTSLKDIDSKVAGISNGLNVYTSNDKFKRSLNPLFEDIKKKVVDNTRLRVLTLNRSDQLSFEGEAREFTDIAKLVTSLNNAVNVKNTTIVSTSAGKAFKNFSLKADYVKVEKLSDKKE